MIFYGAIVLCWGASWGALYVLCKLGGRLFARLHTEPSGDR